jgi:hypothetical protein
VKTHILRKHTYAAVVTCEGKHRLLHIALQKQRDVAYWLQHVF